jgi:hypothetical protein
MLIFLHYVMAYKKNNLVFIRSIYKGLGAILLGF